jgi:hypothetical protein
LYWGICVYLCVYQRSLPIYDGEYLNLLSRVSTRQAWLFRWTTVFQLSRIEMLPWGWQGRFRSLRPVRRANHLIPSDKYVSGQLISWFMGPFPISPPNQWPVR